MLQPAKCCPPPPHSYSSCIFNTFYIQLFNPSVICFGSMEQVSIEGNFLPKYLSFSTLSSPALSGPAPSFTVPSDQSHVSLRRCPMPHFSRLWQTSAGGNFKLVPSGRSTLWSGAQHVCSASHRVTQIDGWCLWLPLWKWCCTLSLTGHLSF